MTKNNQQRREERRSVSFPSGVRVVTEHGDCLADIIDISPSGIGLRVFDYLGLVDLAVEQTVMLKVLIQLDPSTVRESTGDLSAQMNESTDTEIDPLDIRAKVAWAYLNRVGLSFLGAPRYGLFNAILKREQDL